MTRLTRCSLLTVLACYAAGCGGDGNVPVYPQDLGVQAADQTFLSDQTLDDASGLADMDPSSVDPMPSGPSIIQRIQQGDIEQESSVMVTDVVVVSRAGFEGFFISDGSTAPFSGIYVYHPNAATLSIEVGDLVTLVGLVREYFDLTQIVMNEDAEVRVDGTGSTPDPVSISMEELCDPESAEAWEGMLVSVDNVTVNDVAVFGGFSFQGREGGCTIDANPMIAPIDIGRLFFGQSISRVTGLLHFAFDAFQILPRSVEDVITEPLTSGVVSITEVRNGDVPVQSRVTFQGVTVIGYDDFFIYVSTPEGGANSGFRITDRERTMPVNQGDKIDVDLIVLSESTGRLNQARRIGPARGPEAAIVDETAFRADEFRYALVQLERLTVANPDPFLEFVEEDDEIRVYGDSSAAFELTAATVSRRLMVPSFPFLRAGDLFDALIGIRLDHGYELIEDGVLVEKNTAAIAPREATDFINYRPTCDARLCVADLAPGDLVITEIFYGGTCEWIEIKNMRADSIDLTNIKIGEREPSRPSDQPWTFANQIIEGDSLAIVGCQPGCTDGFQFIESDLGGPLANDGDVIEIWAGDLLFDGVTYEPRRTAGIQLMPGSVEGHPGREIMGINDDPLYWCDATVSSTCGVGGTPGEINACGLQCLPNRCEADLGVGDLLITEIMADPSSGGNDCEWIELHNTTSQTIELRGLLLVDGAMPNTFRAPNLLGGEIAAGGYGVIMNDASNCQSSCAPQAVASWSQHASLNNLGDTISLAAKDLIIDQVTYSQPPQGGISWQRDGVQWCESRALNPACAQELATPSTPNSCN